MAPNIFVTALPSTTLRIGGVPLKGPSNRMTIRFAYAQGFSRALAGTGKDGLQPLLNAS